MKQKILLAIFSVAFIHSAEAQKKSERNTAYAITGVEKGNRTWKEVKLVDMETGDVVSPVYESKSTAKRLNARTGKEIKITESTPLATQPSQSIVYIDGDKNKPMIIGPNGNQITVIRQERAPQASGHSSTYGHIPNATNIIINRHPVSKDQPFATNSAALAYDKKNNRLYYTPMGINQLRYIDLKSKTPTVYYFEDEDFGTVSGSGDVRNQITRMVIASDGNGYALTNDANQLIQFTTRKKPVITNLGSLTDDPSNGKFSVHSSSAYGGDMVADNKNNLFLITANRRVYRVSIETRVAVYVGSIKGLPEGYTTNGAVVENENSIIVTSSTSTRGYYRFKLDDLQAELVSKNGSVFNASDLANGNLLSSRKKEEEKPQEIVKEETLVKEEALQTAVEKSIRTDIAKSPALSLYPNPVTNFTTRLSMADYPEGRYEIQLLDLTGKQINKQSVQVNSKQQVLDFRIPSQVAKGTYLLRIMNSSNQAMNVEKLIVQ